MNTIIKRITGNMEKAIIVTGLGTSPYYLWYLLKDLGDKVSCIIFLNRVQSSEMEDILFSDIRKVTGEKWNSVASVEEADALLAECLDGKNGIVYVTSESKLLNVGETVSCSKLALFEGGKVNSSYLDFLMVRDIFSADLNDYLAPDDMPEEKIVSEVVELWLKIMELWMELAGSIGAQQKKHWFKAVMDAFRIDVWPESERKILSECEYAFKLKQLQKCFSID